MALVLAPAFPNALGVEIDETRIARRRDLSADTLRRLADAGL
ncbi:MAG: hypothetical protein R2713_18800 [Ilumatobacteraceae bacterium]